MPEAPRTDRLGISRVEYFFSTHGWLFREQFTHDYGIDAQVEIVESYRPTGDLIAIQIKTGKSYFSEKNAHGVVFRTNETHIDYWFRHSLPVIVIIFDPDQNICLWESVTEETIVNTGQGWKIVIPHNKTLDDSSLKELKKITQPPEYFKKLNKLRLDKKWINLLAEGETIYIEYENWINKSLPRFDIRIGCSSRNNIEEESWPTLYGASMEAAIAYTIPWAEYEMDTEAHYYSMQSVWYDECYTGIDEDTRKPEFYISFSEWYNPPEEIVPISNDGETEGYRLLLSLNNIGKAFYYLDDYLSENDNIGTRVFS